mmetsp:Transcript_10216/g.30176  ORF Transcript_10216/g.30176 Transcript_10216/m.30176 type:complete len:159 (-) Transcript_10216:127-603(-)
MAMARSKRDLRIFSLIILCTSIFFWVWAIINTSKMESGYDLGIFSFLSTALSSAYLLAFSRPGIIPLGKCAQVLIFLTHLFVSTNYALGTMFAFKWLDTVKVGFGIYCSIFIVVWLIVGAVGYFLIGADRRAVDGKESSEAGEGSGIVGESTSESSVV